MEKQKVKLEPYAWCLLDAHVHKEDTCLTFDPQGRPAFPLYLHPPTLPDPALVEFINKSGNG